MRAVQDPTRDADAYSSGSMFFAGGLFFVSGFASLTYQVLWQRELGLLFGNTTQATSTALAVFFLGLAAGSWWIGRRSAHIEKPLPGPA